MKGAGTRSMRSVFFSPRPGERQTSCIGTFCHTIGSQPPYIRRVPTRLFRLGSSHSSAPIVLYEMPHLIGRLLRHSFRLGSSHRFQVSRAGSACMSTKILTASRERDHERRKGSGLDGKVVSAPRTEAPSFRRQTSASGHRRRVIM